MLAINASDSDMQQVVV